MIPQWLAEHQDLRLQLSRTWSWGVPEMLGMLDELEARIAVRLVLVLVLVPGWGCWGRCGRGLGWVLGAISCAPGWAPAAKLAGHNQRLARHTYSCKPLTPGPPPPPPQASGRDYPLPKESGRRLKQVEAEEARDAAIAEQEREQAALARLGCSETGASAAGGGVVVGAGAAWADGAGVGPAGAAAGARVEAEAAAEGAAWECGDCCEPVAGAVELMAACRIEQ
jgi:hypothetical protein